MHGVFGIALRKHCRSALPDASPDTVLVQALECHASGRSAVLNHPNFDDLYDSNISGECAVDMTLQVRRTAMISDNIL